MRLGRKVLSVVDTLTVAACHWMHKSERTQDKQSLDQSLNSILAK